MCLHNPSQFLAGFSALSLSKPLVLLSDSLSLSLAGPAQSRRPSRKAVRVLCDTCPVQGPLFCGQRATAMPREASRRSGSTDKGTCAQQQASAVAASAKTCEAPCSGTWSPSGGLVCSMCCSMSPSSLNPFFQAMEREISAAFDSGEPEDVLSRAFKLDVTRDDISTLRPQGWLNDKVWDPALPGKPPFPGHRSLPGAPLQSPQIAVHSYFGYCVGWCFWKLSLG